MTSYRQFRSDYSVYLHFTRCLREANRATQFIMIRERERRETEVGRARCQHLGQRRAIEQGEGGVGVELGILRWTVDSRQWTVTTSVHCPLSTVHCL